MAEDTMELRDLVGPYTGQVRTYLRHAGENALSHGFAEHVEPEAERELSPRKRYSSPPGVGGAPTPELPKPVEVLAPEFPGRQELIAAGFDTIGKIPRDEAALVGLPGIGKTTAKKILAALGGE